jgi:uncharacterized protein (DUF885 family)
MIETTPDIRSLADEYWQASLAFDPLGATAIGDRRFDDRLDDPSPEAIAAQRRRLAELRGRVEAVDAGALGTEDAVTHAALLAQLRSDEAQLATGLERWSVDPLEGPHIAALNIPDYQAVATPEQARAMVTRWQGLPAWFDAHGRNLRDGLAAGQVAVATPVAKVVEATERILRTPDDELPLLAPARIEHPDWPPDEVARFRHGLAAAVREIRPALERYLAVVRDEIRPRARPDTEPGVGRVPGGDEAYRALVRVHTSLDLEPEAIHELGVREVERIDAELVELGRRVLGATDHAAILERLRSDRSLAFTSRDEVFAKAEAALARANEATPDWFGILPKAPCVVVRMGPHEEEHSTLAYYRQPAVDGSRPGQYFLNTSAPDTRPRYEAEALAYHEAVPGHHLQIAIGQERTGLPEFRKHLGPTAFFEGWGLYAERLSDEMGLYSADLDRIGILSFDGWRACRLVLDTGIHALGWTRQQAIDFMAAHTALSRNNIENEVDRYIVWPGQALAYKLGQLEILRLREETRARQGAGFDIRTFHDAVLENGALGLEALRATVERRLGLGQAAPA